MSVHKFVFDNGFVQTLNAFDATPPPFTPLHIIDEVRPPRERRKRPKGQSMSPRSVRHNTYETYLGSYDDVIYSHVSQCASGWWYTTRCDGGSDPTPIASTYSNSVVRGGLLGAGGYGADYLYFQANRLKAYGKRYITLPSSSLGGLYVPLMSQNGLTIDIIQSEIDDLKRKVVSDTLDAYDAGTEFAERTKTIQTIFGILRSCVSPLNTLRRALSDFKQKPGTTLSDYILQYEYAIRPLLYSMEQIRKIQKDRAKMILRKSRSKSITFSTNNQVPTTGAFFREEGSVEVRLRACSYYKFDDELDRVTSSIRFNPLLTAWELIPFSFVLDWFIGVGDWLVNQTACLTQVGANALFCVSVRKFGSYDTVYNPGDIVIPMWTKTETYSDNWSDNTCFQQDRSVRTGSGPVNISKTLTFPEERHTRKGCTLSSTSFNQYDRSLFIPSSVPIELNNIFELSKRRLLDSICLLVAQLK